MIDIAGSVEQPTAVIAFIVEAVANARYISLRVAPFGFSLDFLSSPRTRSDQIGVCLRVESGSRGHALLASSSKTRGSPVLSAIGEETEELGSLGENPEALVATLGGHGNV